MEIIDTPKTKRIYLKKVTNTCTLLIITHKMPLEEAVSSRKNNMEVERRPIVLSLFPFVRLR
jgi:hypothetical protein